MPGYLAAGLAIGPFGLGVLSDPQTTLHTAELGVVMAFGFSLAVSFESGMGCVLTPTVIAMQLLGERGDVAAPREQKIVSIVLFEDLLIVSPRCRARRGIGQLGPARRRTGHNTDAASLSGLREPMGVDFCGAHGLWLHQLSFSGPARRVNDVHGDLISLLFLITVLK